ncbi:lipoprotein [Chlamydia abortus]|nr:lipoprotein [Chlamydia abortus]
MFSVTNPALLTPQEALPEQKRFAEIWQAINSQEVIELYGKQFPVDYVNTTVLANGKKINSLIPPANE